MLLLGPCEKGDKEVFWEQRENEEMGFRPPERRNEEWFVERMDTSQRDSIIVHGRPSHAQLEGPTVIIKSSRAGDDFLDDGFCGEKTLAR